MLRSAQSIMGYHIECLDGRLGVVSDLYFEANHWAIRYLVVNPRPLLPGRKVLIPPAAASQPDWSTKSIPLNYTREQVENSPDIDADKPVSRQEEANLHHYFQWVPYWGPAATGAQPLAAPVERADMEERAQAEQPGDPTLRSFAEVCGYTITAQDGEIGHVEDMIFEDEDWLFQLFVVDTRNWLPGKRVVLDTEWIWRVDHSEHAVHIDLQQEAVRSAPEYDPAQAVNEEYQQQLYDYYGRPKQRASE